MLLRKLVRNKESYADRILRLREERYESARSARGSPASVFVAIVTYVVGLVVLLCFAAASFEDAMTSAVDPDNAYDDSMRFGLPCRLFEWGGADPTISPDYDEAHHVCRGTRSMVGSAAQNAIDGGPTCGSRKDKPRSFGEPLTTQLEWVECLNTRAVAHLKAMQAAEGRDWAHQSWDLKCDVDKSAAILDTRSKGRFAARYVCAMATQERTGPLQKAHAAIEGWPGFVFPVLQYFRHQVFGRNGVKAVDAGWSRKPDGAIWETDAAALEFIYRVVQVALDLNWTATTLTMLVFGWMFIVLGAYALANFLFVGGVIMLTTALISLTDPVSKLTAFGVLLGMPFVVVAVVAALMGKGLYVLYKVPEDATQFVALTLGMVGIGIALLPEVALHAINVGHAEFRNWASQTPLNMASYTAVASLMGVPMASIGMLGVASLGGSQSGDWHAANVAKQGWDLVSKTRYGEHMQGIDVHAADTKAPLLDKDEQDTLLFGGSLVWWMLGGSTLTTMLLALPGSLRTARRKTGV